MIDEAGGGDVIQIVRASLGIGAILPPAGERAIDQAGVCRAQRLVIAAEASHHARPEALDQHIRARREAMQRCAPAFLLEVEDDRPLAAVAGLEESAAFAAFIAARREPAAIVAAMWVFDFDDLGAELGEQPGADVAGEKAGEIEDARPMEGRDHAASIARAGTSPP